MHNFQLYYDPQFTPMEHMMLVESMIDLCCAVVDSGASYHIISNTGLTERERKHIRKLRPPIPLQTANGQIKAKSAVKIHIHELNL